MSYEGIDFEGIKQYFTQNTAISVMFNESFAGELNSIRYMIPVAEALIALSAEKDVYYITLEASVAASSKNKRAANPTNSVSELLGEIDTEMLTKQEYKILCVSYPSNSEECAYKAVTEDAAKNESTKVDEIYVYFGKKKT